MITLSRITLRLARADDLEALFALESDLANRGGFYPAQLTGEPSLRRQFESSGFWTDDHGVLLVVDKSDRIIGKIFYIRASTYWDALEIGYIIYDPSQRGRGHTSAALAAFVDLLFETRQVNRLQLVAMPENRASRKVAEKCGFRHEGTVRGAVFIGGRHVDVELLALLRADWLERRKAR